MSSTIAPTNTTSIDCVRLDGLVLMKILKHCREFLPEAVSGHLLGLDVRSTLEVTGCFPMPLSKSPTSSEEDQDAEDNYQFSMMKLLREVNVDSNNVGWYQSVSCGDMMNDASGAQTWSAIVENQFLYQKSIPSSVVIVYDPFRTTHGSLALKAYRLTDAFMSLYEAGDLSSAGFSRHHLASGDIFESIPIKVHNSNLGHAFLYELREKRSLSCEHERLSMSQHDMVARDLQSMGSAIQDYAQEQGRYQFYQRSVARQKLLQDAYQARKRAAERGTGEAAPSEAERVAAYKKITAPSRLDTFLISHQIRQFCDHITSNCNQSFSRVFATKGIMTNADADDDDEAADM